jgi:hypothetical protein
MDTCVKPYIANQQIRDIFPMILKPVVSGEIPVYGTNLTDNYDIYQNCELSFATVIGALGYPQAAAKTAPAKNKTSIHTNQAYTVNDLYGLSFWEELEVTENPVSIRKKVLGYAPFRQLFIKEDIQKKNPLYKRTFLVLDTLKDKTLMEQSDKRMVLVHKVKYEYFLYADVSFFSTGHDFQLFERLKHMDENNNYSISKYSAPFLNPYGAKRFINLLLDQINNYGMPAYDFETGAPLNREQIKKNLGITEQVLSNEIREDGTMVSRTIVNEFDPATVQSILFTEEWYIDPLTLRMQKKITAISPVVFTYKEEDTEKQHPGRKVLFTLKTNEFAN